MQEIKPSREVLPSRPWKLLDSNFWTEVASSGAGDFSATLGSLISPSPHKWYWRCSPWHQVLLELLLLLQDKPVKSYPHGSTKPVTALGCYPHCQHIHLAPLPAAAMAVLPPSSSSDRTTQILLYQSDIWLWNMIWDHFVSCQGKVQSVHLSFKAPSLPSHIQSANNCTLQPCSARWKLSGQLL